MKIKVKTFEKAISISCGKGGSWTIHVNIMESETWMSADKTRPSTLFCDGSIEIVEQLAKIATPFFRVPPGESELKIA